MKLSAHPEKSCDVMSEGHPIRGPFPDDDLDVTINRRSLLASALHPRCRRERDDLEWRLDRPEE